MDKHPERVSKAIALMRKEGVPEKQAVAKALAMMREGRLREDGSYKPVHPDGKEYM